MFGSDLYVTRVKRDGSLASSKPCFRCLEWIIECMLSLVSSLAVDLAVRC